MPTRKGGAKTSASKTKKRSRSAEINYENVKDIIDSIPGDLKATGQLPINNLKGSIKPISKFNKNQHAEFMFFFKRLIMQPFMREYLIKRKHGQGIPYVFIKLDLDDPYYSAKIDFIQRIIRSEGDFILDLAEQLDIGGHYTSLKRMGGVMEFMDPDPFNYGSDNVNSEFFHSLFNKIPYSENLLGKNNRTKYGLKAHRSIQNLHQYDTYCQSWSLLFLLFDEANITLPIPLNYQNRTINFYNNKEKDLILIKDKEEKKKYIENYEYNFELFKQNMFFLFDFWISIFKTETERIDDLLKSHSYFMNWTSEQIKLKLGNIRIEIEGMNSYKFKKKIRLLDLDLQTKFMIEHRRRGP